MRDPFRLSLPGLLYCTVHSSICSLPDQKSKQSTSRVSSSSSTVSTPNTPNPPVTSGGHTNPDPHTNTAQVQVTVHKHFFLYVNVVNWTSFILRLHSAFQVEQHREIWRTRERICERHHTPVSDRAVSARHAPRSGTASARSV